MLSLEELDGCIPDGKRLEESLEARELARSISAFLRTEPGEARQMFVLRYFYCEPVEAIAQRLAWDRARSNPRWPAPGSGCGSTWKRRE